MKFIFALCLIAVGAMAAPAEPHPGRVLAESLEKRGDALIAHSKKFLEELHKSGHHHLAGNLEHQLVLVEALVLDLKTQLANKDHQHQLHHLHVIEEDLLHLENRISEEMYIINEIKNHHKHENHPQNVLVTKGEALVKQAKEQLAKHSHTKEAKQIEHEIHAVEVLIKAIAAKPAADVLKKEEEQLARHEKTLAQLLEKASHRNPGHHHEHKPHEPHQPHEHKPHEPHNLHHGH